MRVLVYRLGSLGDTVLALPCFHLIREAFPDAEITVLTNAPVSGKAAPLEAVLGSSGLIDHVVHYPVGLRDLRQVASLVRQLRAQNFEVAISLAAARGIAASLRDTLFLKAAGIPRIIGVPFRKQDLVCTQFAPGGLYESEARRLLRRIHELGEADPMVREWSNLHLTERERDEASQLLLDRQVPPKFIAASVGTKTPLNDWGVPKWTELFQQLSARHPGLGAVLLGSPDEAPRSAQLLEHWQGPRANLCGAASPRVSAAILERAAVFVGHDSGPMHLAAAAGTHCVAVFSARCPPGQWFPLGEKHAPLYPYPFYDPAKIDDASHQRNALDSIQVSAVLAAVEKILADSP